jgi:hypothetical protein
MALTAAQKVDCRRWLGYDALDSNATGDYVVTVYGVDLNMKLDSLSAAEESTLKAVFIDRLSALELGVLDATVDSKAAGTWQANPREIDDRQRLFKIWARKMAAFLGVEPGPGLGSGGMKVVRC